MRNLSSNLKPNHSVNFREQVADLCERTDYPRVKRTEDISRERGIESQLRPAAQRAYPRPRGRHRSHGGTSRQAGKVLELQNSDRWLRRTDLSWHFPILMTIREEPFKNYRLTTFEKWKAKDKAEEFKKQKMQKNDDGHSYAIVLVMAPTNDLGVLFLATMELGRNA